MINEKFPGIATYIIDAFVAAQRSKVTRKRMGSVLVGRRAGNVWQVIVDACNGVDIGAEHKFEENGVTLPHVYHAEQNVIAKLYDTRMDVDTDMSVYKDIVLIVMSSPCPTCAKQIQTDIPVTDVIYVESYRDQTGVQILKDAGIRCHQLTVQDIEKLIDSVDNVRYEMITAKAIGMECLTAIRNFKEICLTLDAQHSSDIPAWHKNELHAVLGFARKECTFEDSNQRRMLRYSLISLARQFPEAIVNDVPDEQGIDKVFQLTFLNKYGNPCCVLKAELAHKYFMSTLST